ncbi:MAG: hypothetical protein ACYDEX_23975 [Mobilitalea sp.]
MFNKKVTVGDYIEILYKIFEDESNGINKAKTSELKALDSNILKKGYKYYSFSMLLYLINKVTDNEHVRNSIFDVLLKMYYDKYDYEKEIIMNRLEIYLSIIEKEFDLRDAIKKAAYQFSQYVNGGLGTILIAVTNFTLFLKYYTDTIKDIVNILSLQNEKKQF